MKNVYDERPADDLTGRLAEARRMLNPADIKGKKILDIGCGYGWCELELLRMGAASVIGIEINQESLSTAKRNIRDKRASFKVASAIDQPFPDGSFDAVVSWDVLEHIPKGTENQMFSGVNRVLKKGGRFYISTPYNSFWSKMVDPGWWFIGHRHYSRAKLERFGRENGFKVEGLKVKGGFWTLLFIFNMYFSKWILRRKPLFYSFFLRKEEEEYRRPYGRANAFVIYRKV